jgi:FlaA1/EpsC-like NDP-sugar epimerase
MEQCQKSLVTNSTILLTGATGSFGNAFVKQALTLNPKAIRCYSRDELKQSQMAAKFNDDRLRFLIGDVRDLERLRRACRGVDYIIHTAAMKRIEVCEYNPKEAVSTNIGGAMNIIEAALDCGVKRILALSTDKCVHAVNLYGKTKAVAESLLIQANVYGSQFSVVRYGNVMASRGSVIPLFQAQKAQGYLTITPRYDAILAHPRAFCGICFGVFGQNARRGDIRSKTPEYADCGFG